MNKKELPIKMDFPEEFFKEEEKCGFTVTEKMKAIWAVELDMYEELRKVCEKYGLTLYADGGTVLGAVRHKGFIPWDDDMDLCMPRDDYEKLCEIAKNEFKYPYFWQTEETDPGTVRGHAQLRNSETAAIDRMVRVGKNHGIFIDIFPLDNVPDDSRNRHEFLERLCKVMSKKSILSQIDNGINLSTGIKGIVKKILIAYRATVKASRNPFYEKAERMKKIYNKAETKTWANLFLVIPDNLDRWVYKKEFYEETIWMDFETTKVLVPGDYNGYLDHCYGNWEEYVIGASVHGSIQFDPYKSYTDILCGE